MLSISPRKLSLPDAANDTSASPALRNELVSASSAICAAFCADS